MKINKIIMLSLCCFASGVMAESETLSYKNTKGSSLILQFNKDNTLSGTFTTAVASKECQQAIGMKRPVTGYYAKNSLAFTVNYPACGSVVSFAGNIEHNNLSIDTTAIIVHPSQDSAKDGPGSRMLSHDIFSKIPA